jgi:hypothetical protein
MLREAQAFSDIAIKGPLDESLGLAPPGFSHVFDARFSCRELKRFVGIARPGTITAKVA